MGPRPEDRGNRRRSPSPCPIRSGFKGAAARRPRELAADLTALRDQVKLQWGRGTKTAGTRGLEAVKLAPGAASMGPRPEDRGNRTAIARWTSSTAGFNGAAARRPRELPD